jgi:hypothetical protein
MSEGPLSVQPGSLKFHPVANRNPRDLAARLLLPSPVSGEHALSVLILGFAVEGATEVYQFVERGNLAQGWPVYYATLAATILGFYLMFLGFREWYALRPRPVRRKSIPWFGLALWVGGTAMTSLLSIGLGTGRGGATPFWIAGPVGGLIVLTFGNFFYGLRKLAEPIGSPAGNSLGWVAFAWSLGVATVAGLAVGDRAFLLLTEFVTNWGALVDSVAPVVIAMSPLFVTYALLVGAFWPARRRLIVGMA